MRASERTNLFYWTWGIFYSSAWGTCSSHLGMLFILVTQTESKKRHGKCKEYFSKSKGLLFSHFFFVPTFSQFLCLLKHSLAEKSRELESTGAQCAPPCEWRERKHVVSVFLGVWSVLVNWHCQTFKILWAPCIWYMPLNIKIFGVNYWVKPTSCAQFIFLLPWSVVKDGVVLFQKQAYLFWTWEKTWRAVPLGSPGWSRFGPGCSADLET